MPSQALHTAISVARESLRGSTLEQTRAIVGFDGFVDEIVEVVDKRTGWDAYTRIDSIAGFGERVSRAAGLSANIELVPKVVKLGGNGPIMANALLSAGFDTTYIGCIGKDGVHPVFQDFAEKCRVISVADPGHTDALEFSDGKIMMGKLETIKDVNWENLTQALTVEDLVDLVGSARLIAAVNWTMIPHMTDIWEHLLTDVFPKVTWKKERPILFFDLADPAKRANAEIAQALEVIQRFNNTCPTFLGLNRNEATEIADVLELHVPPDSRTASLEAITRAIAERLEIHGVVVHPVNQAACMVEGQFAIVDGPFTSKPRLTTGAGDNFNAGFCLGQAFGLDPGAALILGTGTSGFYVRQMTSPTLQQLEQFLERWSHHVGEDFD